MVLREKRTVSRGRWPLTKASLRELIGTDKQTKK